MKFQSLRNLLLLITLFSSIIIFSQPGKPYNKFFASYEDYVNNKILDDYDVSSGSWMSTFGKESFIVYHDHKTKRRNLSDFPSEFYTLDDNLMRNFDNRAFVVLLVGHFCLYVPYSDRRSEYYSEGIAGKLKGFNDRFFKKQMKQYGLLEQYEQDKPKRERKDTPYTYIEKLIQRDIKYLGLVNDKIEPAP